MVFFTFTEDEVVFLRQECNEHYAPNTKTGMTHEKRCELFDICEQIEINEACKADDAEGISLRGSIAADLVTKLNKTVKE